MTFYPALVMMSYVFNIPNIQGCHWVNKRYLSSEKLLFFGYFIFHILLGSILLKLPIAWTGPQTLKYLDTFFTAVSAVCVTGLATVDTAQFSLFGQLIILYLIQAGGLGIITFSTLYLLIPGSRISMKNRKIIREYYVDSSGVNPRNIVRNILLFTFVIEFTGALILSFFFYRQGVSQPILNGLFHGISAFCNAGFSRFSDSMMGFRTHLGINITLMFLIILGGLGFMTIWDSLRNLFDWRKRLHFHTKVMLLASAGLIMIGWISFFVLEFNDSMAGFTLGDKILSSLFQSITTRTAGFNSIDQAELSRPSWAITLVLMIIGGGSGSTAGGLKVSTALILFLVFFRRMNSRGESRLFHRRVSSDTLSRASMLFLKAMGILFFVILGLLISEGKNQDLGTGQLIYEAFSALGTVGLSQGITAQLSPLGKGIIILTMFAGRVGLFALVMPDRDQKMERHIDYPIGEVLIG